MRVDYLLLRQHISVRVFNGYINYVKENFPNIDIDQILIDCGIDPAHFLDESNWVSTVFDEKFTACLIDTTGVKNLPFLAGQFAVTKKSLGSTVYYSARLLASTGAIFKQIAKYTSSQTKVIEVAVLKAERGKIVLNIRPVATGLSEEERLSLELNFPNIVSNAIGYYSAIPKIHGNSDAKIVSNRIDNLGLSEYTLEIKFREFNALFRSISTLCSIFSPIAIGIYLNNLNYSTLLVTLLSFCSMRLYWMWVNARETKSISKESEESNKSLEYQYKELLNSKQDIDRKNREQFVINSLLQALISVQSNDQILSEGCKILIDKFGIDRAIILSINESRDSLIFANGSSSISENLALFKTLQLPIEIESDDPNKLSNVFRYRRSILIEDCVAHLKTLSIEGAQFLQATGSTSFICVPIVADSDCLGLLIVDAITKQKKLTTLDLTLCESVAAALAASLANHQLRSQREDALERSGRFKDQILANTSHELRTPLHGIINLARLLSESAAERLNKKELELISSIYTSGQRLSRLVNDILDLSKLNYSKLEIILRPVNLYSALETSALIFVQIARQKSIVLDISSIQKNWIILADRDRLDQILFNLLGNAIKFTDSGEISLVAELSVNFVKITVRDTGIGIAEEFRDSVFQPFIQSDNSIQKGYAGTGLGLSITKALVEAHGGKIWINPSDVGTSVSFTVQFSHIAKEQSDLDLKSNILTNQYSPVVEEYEARQTELISNRKSKILIVDDEPVNITVLTHYIEQAGYECFVANDGLAALELIESMGIPDLVLMDVMMPRMNGFDCCKEIRKKYSRNELPLIFLTAKSEDEDIINGFDAGGSDYISKPFVKEVLISRVKNQLSQLEMQKVSSRFVPWGHIKLLGLDNIANVKIGSAIEREVAIQFIDVRGFTEMLEDMHPADAMKFINSLLGHIVPILLKHNGIVDKYIGDCVMTVFCNPESAINAAVEVQTSLASYNSEHRSGGLRKQIEVGVGIHWGRAIVGAVGIDSRMDVTVLSDTINTGSRLQEMTKFFRTQIIVSSDLLAQCVFGVSPKRRILGHMPIRGRRGAIEVHEVYEAMSQPVVREKTASSEMLKESIDFALNHNYKAALLIVARLINEFPLDLSLFAIKESLENKQLNEKIQIAKKESNVA